MNVCLMPGIRYRRNHFDVLRGFDFNVSSVALFRDNELIS